jgi:hypothetical protein
MIVILGISLVCTPFLSIFMEKINNWIYGNNWYSKSASVNVFGEKKYVYPVSVTSDNLFYYFCYVILLTIFIICVGIVIPIYNNKYNIHYKNTGFPLIILIFFIIVFIILNNWKKLMKLRT